MESNLLKHEWIVGDVFTTNFWGVPEVCIIRSFEYGEVCFIRLESIRKQSTIKKDYCAAALEKSYFERIQKTFIHHSNWYLEYRDVMKQKQKS